MNASKKLFENNLSDVLVSVIDTEEAYHLCSCPDEQTAETMAALINQNLSLLFPNYDEDELEVLLADLSQSLQ